MLHYQFSLFPTIPKITNILFCTTVKSINNLIYFYRLIFLLYNSLSIVGVDLKLFFLRVIRPVPTTSITTYVFFVGLFIFIIFICKRKTYNTFIRKFNLSKRGLNKRQSTITSTTGMSVFNARTKNGKLI